MSFDDLLATLDARHGVSNGQEERFCDCAETLIRGERKPMPPGHDCRYVAERNALIRTAEEIVDSRITCVPPSEDAGESHALWTKCFSIAMDELAKPLLNGSSPKNEN